MDKPFPAYQGDAPYVFVCYAHEDSDIVYPEIAWLREQGTNLWYDEGIAAGRNWRAAIGDSLLGASQVLFYITARSLVSDHCNREINLSLDEGKDLVPVYLEDVELTSDMKVGLNRVQALHRDQDANYLQHLLDALRVPSSDAQALPSQPEVPRSQVVRRHLQGPPRGPAVPLFEDLFLGREVTRGNQRIASVSDGSDDVQRAGCGG